MGLITVCIGTGPLGQILIGALAERFGPLAAVVIIALLGLGALTAVAILWFRAERRGSKPRTDGRTAAEPTSRIDA
jgi:hypothetical protein